MHMQQNAPLGLASQARWAITADTPQLQFLSTIVIIYTLRWRIRASCASQLVGLEEATRGVCLLLLMWRIDVFAFGTSWISYGDGLSIHQFGANPH